MTREEIMEREEISPEAAEKVELLIEHCLEEPEEEIERLTAISKVLKLENDTFEDLVDTIGVTETLKLGERCVYLKQALDLYETVQKLDAEVAILAQLEKRLENVAQVREKQLNHIITPDSECTTEEILHTVEKLKRGKELETRIRLDHGKHTEEKEALEHALEVIMGVGESEGEE